MVGIDRGCVAVLEMSRLGEEGVGVLLLLVQSQSHRLISRRLHFLAVGVLGLGVFLEMVGILEGLAPGRRGVSEVSEQAERVSMSSDVSEASLPLRLLARLPARLPARLAGPLVEDGVRLVSDERRGFKFKGKVIW